MTTPAPADLPRPKGTPPVKLNLKTVAIIAGISVLANIALGKAGGVIAARQG